MLIFIIDKMKDSIIAKVAAQTSDFYSAAAQAANVTSLRQLWDKVKYHTHEEILFESLLLTRSVLIVFAILRKEELN